jgi:hypothetical protein
VPGIFGPNNVGIVLAVHPPRDNPVLLSRRAFKPPNDYTATEIIRADYHQAKPPSLMERLADIPEEEICRRDALAINPQTAARLRGASQSIARHALALYSCL